MSQEKVLMKGNEAMAEAAIRAGCRFFFGYPITPQTEVAAYMAKRMPKEGGTYLQAESEIAAINMVYGASSAGARVMTSSSSPGVSLKGEGVSYMAGADLPGVIVNVQRGGPGLGGGGPGRRAGLGDPGSDSLPAGVSGAGAGLLPPGGRGGGVEDLRHQCVHNPNGAGVTISGGFSSEIAKLQNLFKNRKISLGNC